MGHDEGLGLLNGHSNTTSITDVGKAFGHITSMSVTVQNDRSKDDQ